MIQFVVVVALAVVAVTYALRHLTVTTGGVATVRPSSSGPDARRSMLMLAFIPVALIGGFVVGSILLGDPNSADSPQRWAAVARIVPLWAVLEVPSVLGMYWGRRAMETGDPSGRAALIMNAIVFAFFTFATLVGGTIDAFDGI